MNIGMHPGPQLNAEQISSQAGRIIKIEVSQLFIIPAPNFIIELVGGASGADGARGTGTIGSSGGSSAGYVKKAVTGAPVGATAAVLIGAAGLRSAAVGGAKPTNGGTSTFFLASFAELTAGGGVAADYLNAGGGGDYLGVGGIATGGDINIPGQPGALKNIANQSVDYNGGYGGSTPLGLGGVGSQHSTVRGNATGYGAGGAGSRSAAGDNSGDSTPGVCIITILS